MFRALDFRSLQNDRPLRDSMLGDRGRQFVARHNWPLRLGPDGLETDQFDDPATVYCVVEDRGRHLASLRIRSVAAGSMVEGCFAEMWDRSRGRLLGGTEVTRFCASPSLTPDERIAAISDLLLGLCRHCQRTGVERFFGVVFPPVARVIRQCGWESEIIDRMEHPDGRLLLAEWRASEIAAWRIQESREFRETGRAGRQAAAAPASRLVA